ncbi:MAG TPA: choice-of-anchor D domain-containing protein [Solirubrobacteraceae bacterium]|nr:choice-of-anchor D domain-containing protein [Solirubrobacteraceae bacterium]
MPDVLVRRTLPAFALAAMAALTVAAPASAATVVNGGFETGDLSGWTQNVSPSGSWLNYTGTTDPQNGFVVEAPPEGDRAAVTAQFGPGTRLLYQDIVLEAAQDHQLDLQAFYTNYAGSLISPDTLDTNVPNQQYRIEVLTPSAAVDSVDPADILATLFRTQPGDANSRPLFPVSADLSAFAGQTVRLRFAQVDNQSNFSAGVDDVRIASRGLSPSASDLSFGSRVVDGGPTAGQTSTVTNSGNAPVTLSALTLSADAADFERLTGSAGDCTATTSLAPGETCDVRVRFDPSSTGAKAATLTIASDAPERTVALSGTGAPAAAMDTAPEVAATDTAPEVAAPAVVGPARPLPNVLHPWTLVRMADAKLGQSAAGTRVDTGFVAACPASGPACTGLLTLKLLRRSPTTGKVLRVFLTNKVAVTTMPAGTQLRVTFRLNKRGARLLRELGSFTARLRGTFRNGAGDAVVRSTTFRISAPPRRP